MKLCLATIIAKCESIQEEVNEAIVYIRCRILLCVVIRSYSNTQTEATINYITESRRTARIRVTAICNKTDNIRIKVTLRRVRATNAAVKKH